MRTTLDIDDDILLAAKELARRERKTAGEVISELARLGLHRAATTADPGGGAEAGVLGFVPFPRRGPVVTDELIERLREEQGD